MALLGLGLPWGVQWGWSSWLLLLLGQVDILSREFPGK